MQGEIRSFGVHLGENEFSAQYSHTLRAPSFRFHSHSAYEFYVFLHGKIRICIENILYETVPNCMFIFPPNCLHGLLSQDDHIDYERMYFHIPPEFIARLATPEYSALQTIEQATQEMNLLYHMESEQIARLYSAVERIDELSRGRVTPLQELKRDVTLAEVLLLFTDVIEQQKDFSPRLQYQKHPFLSVALRYINDHFTDELTLDDIADFVNVSKYHLSHEFKRLTNNSVMNHVIIKRLQYSLNMLKRNVPPMEACFKSGFSTYTNYQKSFRAYFGVSPREYKTLGTGWLGDSTGM